MNTLWIVLPILTVLMFDLGLTLSLKDFSLLLKQPASVVAALLCQIVLLPVLALAIATAFRLPAPYFIGLVLIACCPGGSSSNLFTRIADGDLALSVLLTALSSIITLFTLPVIMHWTTGMVGEAYGITLPVGNLLKQNLLLMLVPILIGIALRALSLRTAEAIDRVLSKTVFPALLIIVTVFFVQNRVTIRDNIATMGLCVGVLILLACTVGGIVSRLLRLDGARRRTVVIEVGMQNAAQAIAVASSPFIFNSNEIAVPGILYSLLMNLILIAYVMIPIARKVYRTRVAREDATSG